MSLRASLILLGAATFLPACAFHGITLGYAYTDADQDLDLTGNGSYQSIDGGGSSETYADTYYVEAHFGLDDGQEGRDQDALRALHGLQGALDGIRGDLALQRLLAAQEEDPGDEEGQDDDPEEDQEDAALGIVVDEGHEAEEPTTEGEGVVLLDRWAEALASLLALWLAYTQRVAIGRVARKAVGRGEPES